MPTAARKVHSHQALKVYIEEEMALEGPACTLNHLDVGDIYNFSNLFSGSTAHFVGNISEWDVSNAEYMQGMFKGSLFNGDISKWRPVKAERMDEMFAQSQFNGDIAQWRTPQLHDTTRMFEASPFNGSLSGWLFGNVTTADLMFMDCSFAGDASHWDVSRLPLKDAVGMFDPTFKGVFPRVGANAMQRCKFYKTMLSEIGLTKYLEEVPFNSVHLDIAMQASRKPIGMNQRDFDWIKNIQCAAQGLGMTDLQLLDYALAQYYRRNGQEPSWHGVDFALDE